MIQIYIEFHKFTYSFLKKINIKMLPEEIIITIIN